MYRRPDNKKSYVHKGKTYDNRDVIPYNPSLLLAFDCHINVEVCSTVRAVKYLYKYVYKGNDRAQVCISAKGVCVDIHIDACVHVCMCERACVYVFVRVLSVHLITCLFDCGCVGRGGITVAFLNVPSSPTLLCTPLAHTPPTVVANTQSCTRAGMCLHLCH